CVQCRGIESLADERGRAEHEDAVVLIGLGESRDHLSAVRRRQSAVQQQRWMALLPEQSLELVELGDATGEHKTVAATRECRGDIAGDLAVARGIHRDLALDLGEAAGCIEVDLAAEGGYTDAQGPRRDASLLVPSSERSSRRGLEGVPDRPQMPADERLQTIPSSQRRCEPQPEAGTDALHRVIVGRGREMVTLIDNHMPV